MTAVSITINRGQNGMRISDFTVAANAPTASFDFELRFNLTDQLGNPVTRKDVFIAIEAFERAIKAGGNIVTNAPPL